ncbi:MAG: thioesterase family protein [Pseudomonadota bacterium]
MDTPFLTPLGPADLRNLNIPEPWQFGIRDRVRFEELDALNHVNHTAYLRWFEMMRVEYVRAYGISPYDGTGPELVLKAVDMQYHAPMHLHESYVVTARTVSFRRTSFKMAYAVWAPDCRAEGTALIVQLTRGSNDKEPLSDDVRQILIARDRAEAL